jgi:hypothetical protein
MRSRFQPLQAALIFGLGIVVGGGLLGGFMPIPVKPHSATASCTSGDAAADFVCRNTWLANTRHSVR